MTSEFNVTVGYSEWTHEEADAGYRGLCSSAGTATRLRCLLLFGSIFTEAVTRSTLWIIGVGI